MRAAVYYDKYKNGQIGATVLYYVPGNPNVQLASPIQNIGKVDLKGVELEAEFQATKQFKIAGTFALNDSSIKAFFCADCLQVYGNTNAIGHRLAISPKYNCHTEVTSLRPSDRIVTKIAPTIGPMKNPTPPI